MNRGALASVPVLFALCSVRAAAEPDEPTAGDTAGAPRPGDESGRVDKGEEEPVSVGRAIARGVLFVPRVVVTVVFAPVRGAVWLNDRYQITGRYMRIFFNDEGTMGVYPIAQIDSRFGFTGGARFIHTDLFGAHEKFSARAGAGGRYQQRHALTFKSGDRLGDHVTFETAGEFDRRPRETFYGIGNNATGELGRHTQQRLRARTALDVRIAGDFYLRGAGALSKLDYGSSDTGTSIEMVYEPSSIPGFEAGVRDLYGELEMRYDSRRPGSKWDLPGVPSGGGLAAVFVGRDHQYGAAADYWRGGVDLQHFLRLGSGPRTLVTRLRAEVVQGEDVSFTELPMLGGPMLLRGYPIDRFRDRVATLGSVEYQWDLNRHLQGSLFVDAGRVHSRVEALQNDAFEDLRVGYGIGASFNVSKGLVARTNVATSKDGGVFVHVSFDPVFEIKPREERK